MVLCNRCVSYTLYLYSYSLIKYRIVAGGSALRLSGDSSFDPDSLVSPSPTLYNYTWSCRRSISRKICFADGSVTSQLLAQPMAVTTLVVPFEAVVALDNTESMEWQLTLQQVRMI